MRSLFVQKLFWWGDFFHVSIWKDKGSTALGAGSSLQMVRHWPLGIMCPNRFPKGKSRVCVAQHSSFNAVPEVTLYLQSSLPENTAPTARKPGGSSKSQLEFFHFYFPAIEARQQRKIKVNYYMLWVSETSFCFLPRSCTVLRFVTGGSAPVSSPVAFHSHRAEQLLQTSN